MKEFKHLPGLDLIRVFGILVVVFYHYQVETAVRGLCPADFLPAMEPLTRSSRSQQHFRLEHRSQHDG